MNGAKYLNDIAEKQKQWLIKMGWWKNKTQLESLMLIVSECGEAANEVRSDAPTDHFGEELADIILRTLGLAAENDVDIQSAVENKMKKNLQLKPNPLRLK
ncbi:MAG TPA: MazG nucleotide pyrophosphohydrolase domain-containing protein [Methylophilaceae bacterium]|nr:MazG nucleotide pyrophosphohydrolase domain-containing protein [Methylophilaceae bacterium]